MTNVEIPCDQKREAPSNITNDEATSALPLQGAQTSVKGLPPVQPLQHEAFEEVAAESDEQRLPLEFDEMELTVYTPEGRNAFECKQTGWKRVRSGLPAHYNAADILNMALPGRLLVFLGGLHEFKNQVLQRMYLTCWIFCFFLCESLCFLNLIFQEKPYHNFAIDLLTAYVHIPAFRSWLLWRRMVHGPHGIQVAETLSKWDERIATKFCELLRLGSWLAFATMFCMSGIGLSGFSLPGQIAAENVEGRSSTFMYWHALLMWVPIPPVICTIFSGHAFLIIFCVMHAHELDQLKKNLRKTVKNTHQHNPEALVIHERIEGMDMVVDTKDPNAFEKLMKEIHARNLAEKAFDDLLTNLCRHCSKVQHTLSRSCRAWSPLNLHLLLFSWAQVVVVVNNVKVHSINISSVDYRYYWILQDIFHCACGAVTVVAILSLGIWITGRAVHVRTETIKLLEELGIAKVRLATVATLLSRNLTGYSFFGEPINLGRAFPFLFATFLLIFHTFTQIMQVRFSSGN